MTRSDPTTTANPERAAGIVVEVGGARRFVPAGIAREIVPRPVVSRVPGRDLGVALVSGRVVPVIDLGSDREQLVLCDVDGDAVALGGLSVIESGFFDTDRGAVRVGGERVPELDVADAVARTEAALLAAAATMRERDA